MYKEEKMHEVETFVKNSIKRDNDLSVDKFATISGIRGMQFGRELFSTVLPFKDLMKFLEVFPDVQRNLIPRRVVKIKNYVLSGLEDRQAMRFFSAITVTARGHIFYDHNTQKVAIDTNKSKLSVNDGQHRFFGISEAIRELEGKLNKTKDGQEYKYLHETITELKEMIIPIVIFNQISEREEKQLFHDLNNLAQRPARSATIKLAQTDPFSRMARDIAMNNEYMKKYGVEMDKNSIHNNNPKFILLTTIYACIKQLFWAEYKANYQFLNDDNYEIYREIADKTFNNIFAVLPNDVENRSKYIVGKNYTFKGICKFIHHCRYDIKIDETLIFDAINRVDWTPDFKKWSLYGGTRSKRGNLLFGGGAGGIIAVNDCLMDTLKFTSSRARAKLEELEKEKSISVS